MAFRHLRSWVKTTLPVRNNVTPPEEVVNLPEGVILRPEPAVHPPRHDAVPTHRGQIGLFHINPIEPDAEVAPERERYEVDVVAIHGITGDAFNTWTHQNGTNWLKDCLPTALPGARIFTYGYPADVLWTRSTGDIDDFARSLLNGLVRERRQLEVPYRPIILICHSMGGIVAKQALIIARNDDVDYGSIHRSVSAILFLSTPHQGAGITSLLYLPLELVKLASYASLPFVGIFKNAAGKPRKDLVKVLKKESKTLEKISTNFRNSRKHIKIASFIEKSIMPGLHKVIVDDGTGVMHVDEELIVPLHGCDHTTVCRFENALSEGYKSILDVVKVFAAPARENVSDVLPRDTACLKSLVFLEMDTRRSEADNAHPSTCEWILLHESYTKWLNNQYGLLWIKGMPGSGKSTLLAFVYRTLRDSSLGKEELRLQFFFHGRGEKLQKTAIGMFRSLTYQMFIKDISIREPLRRLYQDKILRGDVGVGWNWESPELQKLLSAAILTAAKSRKVIIFIDALDEAGVDAQHIIKFFHFLNDKIGETHSTAKICISCRHYPITAKIPGLDVVVEDHNREDISKYVRATLQSEVRREHGDLDSETWNKLETEIIDKSAGIFQWARLVIPIVLDHYHDGASRADIFRILATVPDELEDVYEYILSKIIKPKHRERTLHLVQWVFLSERPLTVTELRYALICDDKYKPSAPKACVDMTSFVESDDLMVLVVTSWSGGLAEVKIHQEKRIVQFIHQSVNDFFLSGGLVFLRSILNDDTESQRVSLSSCDDIIGIGHDRLARSCIAYFKLEEAELSLGLDAGLDYELFPFLKYATESWFLHAEKAENLGTTQVSLIERFASPPEILAKWIRTYNKINEFSKYCPQQGAKLLHVASSANLKSVVTILLQQNADIEEADGWNNRPLHYAVRRGHKKLAEMLLDAGSIVSARNNDDESPLMLAAKFGDLELVQLLLARGADINDNALQVSSSKGNLTIVHFLLKSGADVNIKSEAHGIPIISAASGGHETVVEELLSYGADITARTSQYCSALQAAAWASYGGHHIMQLLLERGADVNTRGGEYGNALQAAVTRCNRETASLLLDAGADIDAEGGLCGYALQAAAVYRNFDVIELLVERGAKVNLKGGMYGNALQAAAYLDYKEAVEFLLQRGADVNIKGGKCGCAVHAAASKGHFDTILVLIRNKADVNAQDGEWGNPLRAALCMGHIHVAWLLLMHGAQDDTMDKVFNSDLKDAAVKGAQELRAFLGNMVTESKQSSRSDIIVDLAGTELRHVGWDRLT